MFSRQRQFIGFCQLFFSFRDKTNRVTTGETPSMWSDQIFFLSTLSEITIWTPCGKRHIFLQLISKPSTRHLYCWTSITCVCCIWLQKKSLSPILQWKCPIAHCKCGTFTEKVPTYFYFTILANMDFTCTLKFSLLPFSVVVNCKGVFWPLWTLSQSLACF